MSDGGVALSELLSPDLILPAMESREKKAALAELCRAVSVRHGIDPERMLTVLMERERLGSTGVGDGVAIPHGKLPDLDHIIAGFGRSREGVEFASMDDRPAHLFFVLLAPKSSAAAHLKVLARISRLMKSPEVRRALMESDDADEIFETIKTEEDRL